MKRRHGNDCVMVKGQLITHKEVEGLSSAGLRDGGGGTQLCMSRQYKWVAKGFVIFK